MTPHAITAPRSQQLLTVRITPSKGRFTFNIHATRWFNDHAITRISLRVDPILRSVTIRAASPDAKSYALTFRYYRDQVLPVQASFDSQKLLSILRYDKETSATFLIASTGNELLFLADPEYALRAIYTKTSSPTEESDLT